MTRPPPSSTRTYTRVPDPTLYQSEEWKPNLGRDMRAVFVVAARHPKEAEAMASVLQVISSIERICNSAVDIARIVTHRLGIPRELVADRSNAEEVSHRVRIREIGRAHV